MKDYEYFGFDVCVRSDDECECGVVVVYNKGDVLYVV